jgi:TolA-binding protein
MKGTSLKQPRPPFLPPAEERKLNSFQVNRYYKKAALGICLFLLSVPLAVAQEWAFDDGTHKAYELVLNLRTEEAHALLPSPKTAQEHYVTALAEALELLITEDGEKYTEYEDRFQARLERKSKLNDPNDLFLQADLHLQWAFVYFKFGHEFDGALNLRQAYLITQDIKKRFPKYNAIKKTSGLLDVIIGAVPERYDWVLSLLNMQGSVEFGLDDLESLRSADHPLAFEADLLYALTQGFVLQQTAPAHEEMRKQREKHPANKLVLFLGASLAIKNSSSEEALSMLNALGEQHEGLPLYYADYLKGEVYLHKAEYLNSITAYRSFINHYTGQNYIKDAHYKIGLCYWLNGNRNDAFTSFKKARNTGKEAGEADKYAARSLAQEELPHIRLTRARYYTDGGYYKEAGTLLDAITPAELTTKRDKVEYTYRKARLFHKQNDSGRARTFYQQTIDNSGDTDEWYFAPNACLQLAYIALDEKDPDTAEAYFRRALQYKKHEYKNSIDSKAKSALAQLNERK